MGIFYSFNYKVRGVPLWIIGSCGLAGILVDLDHPISYPITGYPSQWLHIPIAVISCIILCSIGAYCGRLYFKLVLTKKRSKSSNLKSHMINDS